MKRNKFDPRSGPCIGFVVNIVRIHFPLEVSPSLPVPGQVIVDMHQAETTLPSRSFTLFPSNSLPLKLLNLYNANTHTMQVILNLHRVITIDDLWLTGHSPIYIRDAIHDYQLGQRILRTLSIYV